MNRSFVSPRSVVGCHGCTLPIAQAILAEGQFRHSENRYDWLGRGVYFWEYAPYRAMEWARLVGLQRGEEPAVLVAVYGEENLPKNTARGGHFRDRLVIDTFCEDATAQGFAVDTVRGTFPEGEPIYPGSKILSLAHTQIAVRNADCITHIRLVQF